MRKAAQVWGLCAISLALLGCDQLLHREFGKIIACDRVRWTSPEIAIDRTMEFALVRELDQHNQCNEGCQEDLRNWRIGAERGARCAG